MGQSRSIEVLPDLSVVAPRPSSRPAPPPSWYPRPDDAIRGEVVSRGFFVVRIGKGADTRYLTDRLLPQCPHIVRANVGPLVGAVSLWGIAPHMLASTQFADLEHLARALTEVSDRLRQERSAATIPLPRQAASLVLVRANDALSVSRVASNGGLLDRRIYDAGSLLDTLDAASDRFLAMIRTVRAA